MPNITPNEFQKLSLSKDEFKFIMNSIFIKKHLKNDLLNKAIESADHVELQISDHQLEDLEAIFSERLQKIGFDKDYKPTDEGRLLETLLDKLSEM